MNKNRIKIKNIQILSTMLLVFILTYLTAPFYYAGDQFIYSSTYSSMAGLSFSEAFISYSWQIGSNEPVHFSIIWLMSNFGLDRNLVMSLANSILSGVLIKLFISLKVHIVIGLTLILTNYYVYVLYFESERLKFAFIFLTLSIILPSHLFKIRWMSIITAVLAHVQIAIIYIAYAFSFLAKKIKIRGPMRKKSLLVFNGCLIIFVLILIPIIFPLMVNHIFGKFHYYWYAAANNSIMSYWQSILFFSLTLLYAKFRMGVVYTFGVIFIIIYLVGPERVNMMAYCFFIYHALKINRGFNFGVIITSFYFAFKSLFFVIDILQTGQGFSRWSIL